jgi:hypothetical protein
VKVNVKGALKINKDKMMLTKIESWEEEEHYLNKSKLKERKGERMYICRSRSDKRSQERWLEKRGREKGENRIQENTDKRGMVYVMRERRN